jgi:hypothetical protein
LEWSIADPKRAGRIDVLMRTLPCAEQSRDDSVIAARSTENERVTVPQRFQITLRIGLVLRNELQEMAEHENHTFGWVVILLLVTGQGSYPCGVVSLISDLSWILAISARWSNLHRFFFGYTIAMYIKEG